MKSKPAKLVISDRKKYILITGRKRTMELLVPKAVHGRKVLLKHYILLKVHKKHNGIKVRIPVDHAYTGVVVYWYTKFLFCRYFMDFNEFMMNVCRSFANFIRFLRILSFVHRFSPILNILVRPGSLN